MTTDGLYYRSPEAAAEAPWHSIPVQDWLDMIRASHDDVRPDQLRQILHQKNQLGLYLLALYAVSNGNSPELIGRMEQLLERIDTAPMDALEQTAALTSSDSIGYDRHLQLLEGRIPDYTWAGGSLILADGGHGT